MSSLRRSALLSRFLPRSMPDGYESQIKNYGRLSAILSLNVATCFDEDRDYEGISIVFRHRHHIQANPVSLRGHRPAGPTMAVSVLAGPDGR
jgi:hypothetical protein